MPQEKSEILIPSFTDTESRVFTQSGEDIYIGKDKIDANLRGILKDEAEYILNSRLWEVLNASITNEAYNLALVKSVKATNLVDAVQRAQMLAAWSDFMRRIIIILSKKEVIHTTK